MNIKLSVFVLLGAHFVMPVEAASFKEKLIASNTKPATYQLLSGFTVELARPKTPIEQYQIAQLAGGVVNKNRLYLPHPSAKRLDCRVLSTGGLVWSSELEAVSQTAWTFSEGALFGADTKGFIYSIDAATGHRNWKAESKGLYFSKPLVDRSKVWILNSSGVLSAYDRITGQWLWQQSDPNPASLSVWSFQGPILFQNLLVAGFPSGILQGFDPQEGRPIWKESFQGGAGNADSFNDLKAIGSNPQYLVASSYSGDLKIWSAADLRSKKLLWEKKISVHAPPTLTEDGVLFASSRDGKVRALDLQNGDLKWEFELPRGLGTQASVAGSKVWLGTTAGDLLVFDRASGNLLAKKDSIESAYWNPPIIISEDEVLVLSGAGILRKIRLVKTS